MSVEEGRALGGGMGAFFERLGERLQSLLPARFRSDVTVVPVVRLSGAIGVSLPFRENLTLAGTASALERAFRYRSAPAVAILVNSPGGSAVQSHFVFKRIRALAEETKKTVLVFVEDVAASGGYMIACAGDEIIADPSSIVGSIGVVYAGFGFVGLLDRLGIERRVHTAGERKAVLDPFCPERAEDVAHLEAMQAEIHAEFIALVRDRRGLKLRESEDLFSGLFWTGRRGVELGLVDRIGDLRSELRARYGQKVRTPLVAERRSWFGRPRFWARQGNSAAEFLAALDERLLWSRFGL